MTAPDSSREQTADLEALANECTISFTRAGGPGGQHRNKVESAVRVTHKLTGVVVVAAERRSQSRNRQAALERLAGKLAQREAERRAADKRARRKKTKLSRAANRRRLDSKQRHGDKKRSRRRVEPTVD